MSPFTRAPLVQEVAPKELKPEKFAVLAYVIATSSEMAALERARWVDVSEDHSTVHLRGTNNDQRDADVPIATLEQAYLLELALAPGAGALLFPLVALRSVITKRLFLRINQCPGTESNC